MRCFSTLAESPLLPQRRRLLLRGLSLAGIALLPSRISAATAAAGHDEFATKAAQLRRQAVTAGDQAYGAVVVYQGKIVGFGPSRVVTDQDPTAHAEMVAIRDAARQLGRRDLAGCLLYSTSHPCRMCETAAYWAGIDRMLVGHPARDAGAPGYGC